MTDDEALADLMRRVGAVVADVQTSRREHLAELLRDIWPALSEPMARELAVWLAQQWEQSNREAMLRPE